MNLNKLYKLELEKIRNDKNLDKEEKYFRTISLEKAYKEGKLIIVYPNSLYYKNQKETHCSLEHFYNLQKKNQN